MINTQRLLFFLLFCSFQVKIKASLYTKESCKFEDPRIQYNVHYDYIKPTINTTELYTNITQGEGFVIIPQAFSKKDIEHARKVIHYLLTKQGKKATHFQGSNQAKPELQARVWNLLNKGQIWQKFVQHPYIIDMGSKILGDDFQLGSIATNTIYPGGSGQEPHIDYPYWDYYNKKHWPAKPKVRDVPFHMNMQVTILLDDFTKENGATAVHPGTQLEAEYPSNSKEFYQHMVQTTGKAGDMIIFVGLLQHCAMPNKSNDSRTGVIIQYLPKFVRPMEDLKRSLRKEVLEKASSALRKLLLLDYPYPSVLDSAEAINSEGSESDFTWKD